MHESASIRAASAIDLSAAMDIALPIFVLVDPMLGEPLTFATSAADHTTAARAAVWQRDITPVPLDASVSLPAHQHPYLVALSGPDDPLLEETVELAQCERTEAQINGLDGHGGGPHRIGGWLQTSMHVEQLAIQLSSMFRVNTSAFTSARYMRQVDRRVLSLLRHVVGEERVRAQLGRLNSWTYVDVKGALTTLRSGSEDITPLRLSTAEWAAMENGELIHRAVAQWLGERERSGEQTPSIETKEICSKFFTALLEAKDAARRWPKRFSGVADLTAWTALSIMHSGIAQSSEVGRFMAGVDAPDEVPDLLRYLHPDLSALANAAQLPGKF